MTSQLQDQYLQRYCCQLLCYVEGRPIYHIITYSGFAVSYCSAVRDVLTTTTLPNAVSLSVNLARSESLPNHHTITYNVIDVYYGSAVSVVLTTTPLPTAVSLSVILARCECRPNNLTVT